MIKLMSIAGARPNFMKLAALSSSVKQYNSLASTDEQIVHVIVHTGQHYDKKMSHSFFEELGIPAPDINLEVGSGSHAIQTAEIMKRFEPVLLEQCPDILLVVGDVNSTIACTLVASKIDYPQDNPLRRPVICHVEAGLRSFDQNMPEEINRILTDTISDLLFVTEESGLQNLLSEGVNKDKIFFVGNVMIDTLHRHLKMADNSSIRQRLGIKDKRIILVTLHRPSNVDQKETLEPLMQSLTEMAEHYCVVFPVHPRTRKKMVDFNLWNRLESNPNLVLTEPLSYFDFLNLLKNSSLVVTDSGGIQEETTVLGVPCITLRDNTERPVTVDIGTNYLIGMSSDAIMEAFFNIIEGHGKKGEIPPLWDGKAADRIVEILVGQFSGCNEA